MSNKYISVSSLRTSAEIDISFRENFTDFIIQEVSIPNTWYNVISSGSAQNNNFDFDGGSSVSLTAGSYSASSLASALQTQIRTVDGTATVAYDEDTMLFTITFSAGRTIDWATGANSTTNLGELLGFDTSADDASATTHTSDYVVNMNQRQIYITSNISNQIVYNTEDSLTTQRKCMYIINVDQGKNNILLRNLDYRVEGHNLQDGKQQHFIFDLIDKDLNRINLNGNSWSMLIKIK